MDVALPGPGFSLHALERNPRGERRVLLLHGWLDHAHSFDWVCEALPETWHTVAVDFRGHGQSDHAPADAGYTFSDYLIDVESARRALGWERFHLVGHSLGGTVAGTYAAAAPDRVESLTLIENLGATGGPASGIVDRLRAFLTDRDRPRRRRSYPSLEAAAARLRETNGSLSEAGALHMVKHGTRAVEGGFEFTFDPAHHRRFALAFDEEQVLAVLRAIECPAQVIYGTRGFSMPPELMQRRLEALRAPPAIAIEGGHHVHLDAPREVAQQIARFISASERGASAAP